MVVMNIIIIIIIIIIQEKRQDHIQDGQKILTKDAQVRTAHPTYGQGSH